ncbi:MAG TPA: AAA family ATPase [Acidimicrobiales bacterium]|nr:AAA family ATPase [Acidimicrobiales bacterium]
MITRIALENWRAYRTLDLDIDPGTTFLVAPNGVGKSSLLEAVRWALGAGHVEQRRSMIRQGHNTARVSVTLALPAGELAVTRSLKVARTKATADTTAILDGREIGEAGALRLLEEAWSAGARFVSRTAFLTEDLRRDAEDPNLRTHLCRAYSLDDLLRAIAEIEPVLTQLSKSLRASRAELSATREQLDDAAAQLETLADGVVVARVAVDAARTTHAGARASLDQARASAASREAAEAWRARHDGLLALALPLVGPLPPGTALADALVDLEDRLGSLVDSTRARQADLRARVAAAEASLATLHGAEAACPVCLRALDDDSRDRAEDLHRATLESVRADLARLDDTAAASSLETVRGLARQAAGLGPAPAVAEAEDLAAAVAAEARAQAALEAAVAGQREAEMKAQAALAKVEAIRADLDAADALTERYRAEALLEAGKAALHQTVTTVLGRQLEPLAAEVNRRWEAVFPDRPNLQLTPDGELSRDIDGAPLEFAAFSAGEQTVAKLMMRLTTLLATTTVPFCWIDEPLEHLDPVSRQLVGSTLAHLSAAGGLEQILVTTYEEPLARRLADLQPGRVRVQYLRTEPAR